MSNFTVYRASAGSGKTFSLVVEYLSIALSDRSGKNYRKILGVTFTNKAAGELKERILKFLKGISVPASDQSFNKTVAEKLTNRLGITYEELAIRAKLTHTDILHNYSRLSISTIDKFVHRLIRSFAKELKLQGDFEIEMDAERVYQKVTQRVIDLVGKDEQLTKWIISWLIGKLEENSGTGDYENKIVRFMFDISTDEAAPFKEKLLKLTPEHFAQAKIKLDGVIKSYEERTKAIGEKGWKIITDAGLGIDEFSNKRSGPGAFFQKLSQNPPVDIITSSHVLKPFETGKLAGAKGHPVVDSITPQLTELFQEIQFIIENELKTYKLSSLLKKELSVLGLAGRLEELLKVYLDEKNLVLISEFNKKIAEVVVNEPAPFIYELLGERYDHFLIDEFQDTSILQWQNFLPLIDNSLAKGGKTLIVGDGKQSIYRFRGGEVEQFQRLPEIFNAPDTPIFKQYGIALERNNQVVRIEENYRSTRNVVEFNNQFIGSLTGFLSERYQAVFDDGMQNPVIKDEGYVQVRLIEDEDEDKNQLHLDHLVGDIKTLLAKGYSKRSCCVLVMRNDDGTQVAQELLANDIQIISEESLVVLFSPKARLLLGCLQLLNDSTHSGGQLNVIENALMLGLLKGDVLELFKKYCFRLTDGNRGQNCNVGKLFSDIGITVPAHELHTKDLYSLSEYFARTLGFMEKYDPFVQFFLDQNLVCLQKEGNNLGNCIEWWAENAANAKVILPEGVDAVRIMTIHKSKGLEFENVFLPFVSWQSQATKKVLWVEPGAFAEPLTVGLVPNSASSLNNTEYQNLNEQENEKDSLDEANKMYVALTRAARNLFVYSSSPRAKKGIAFRFNEWIANREDFNKETSMLTIGEIADPVQHSSEKPGNTMKLERFVSNYDENKLVIGYQAPKYWDPENTSTEKDRGNIIHHLMNEIHSINDLEPVMNKFIRGGMVTEAEQLDIFNSVKRIIELGESQGWMGKSIQARNEMDLLDLAGNRAEIIRPDRVVFNSDSTWVIDYKTGSQLPEHQDQVKKYIRALKDINLPSVRGTLVYLESATIIDIQ